MIRVVNGSDYGQITIEDATKEVEAFKKMVEDAKKPKTGKVKGRRIKIGGVAQIGRALPCHGRGRGCETRHRRLDECM